MQQMTAVEWLQIQLKNGVDFNPLDPLSYPKAVDNLFEKAKQMEKDKYLMFNDFLDTEKTLGISDKKTIERIQWYYNQYYNETYGK